MKNKLLSKLLILLLLIVLCVSLLASCVHPVEETTNNQTSTNEETTSQIEEKWEYVRASSLPDFATQVKLNESNLESDFNITGRGYVTVEQLIDGDTVHFWNYSHTEIIKVRFLAIDTPESTGRVEPWGKPASTYTKTKLKDAYKIVIESDKEGEVSLDSTGGRYLAWVWYKPDANSEWRNLNIEILSDGLAMGKSSLSTRYGSVASEALTSARTNKINLYSGKQDPMYFYGDTIELSIKSLVLNKESYSGIRVRFEGLVTKESGGGIYVESYDEDTAQYYGVYVYGGYASLAPKFLVPGYRLSITGTADNNENFGFQVSGLSFSLINPTSDDTKIIEKNVEVKPTKISADDLLNNSSLENTFVKLDNVSVKSVYMTKNETSSSYGAMTITCTCEGKEVQLRTVKLTLDGQMVTEDYFQGKTMNVCGVIEFYEGTPQIKVFTLADVEFLN